MDDYNYVNFPRDMCMADFDRFAESAKVGERAPDGELVDAATGETVKLSDYWKAGLLVIEFGSVT